MRHPGVICIVLAITLIFVNIACHHPKTDNGGPPDSNSNNNLRVSNSNNGSAQNSNVSGSTGETDEDDVIILRATNDVYVKPKGSQGWLRVVKDWAFHSGDILQVREASKALVDCTDTCELGTGEYSKCCTEECEVVAGIQPTSGAPRTFFMKKTELPEEQAREFDKQQSKISSLALDSTTTQFLRAKLYTAWRLTEAADEVQALDEQLDKPEAKEQLGQAYARVMLKTGDLFVKLDQKEKAADRYQKTINLPPESGTPENRSSIEKAAAHRRLAEIYVGRGKKAEAADQLNRAKEIYVRQGDRKKAEATTRRIQSVRER